jgi:hypothetical protein
LTLVLGFSVSACAMDDGAQEGAQGSLRPSACVKDLDADCKPLYDPPTFDALYTNTLSTTCAGMPGTCHSFSSREGGLAFYDPDLSYDLLLGLHDGRVRVRPGNAACSLLIELLLGESRDDRMPPSDEPLPDAEICTFVRWIQDGAER